MPRTAKENEMKGTPMTQEQITKIMHLYGKGMSGRKIAAEMGLPHSTVHATISRNSLHITSRASVAKEVKKAAPKTAKPVVRGETVRSFTPFTIPEGEPICNATATGVYLGSDLSYRKPKSA